MEVIYEVTKENFPTKIVSSAIISTIQDGRKKKIKVYICSVGRMYSARELSIYLGMKYDGLMRRERNFGINHKFFLAEKMPPEFKATGHDRKKYDDEKLKAISNAPKMCRIDTGNFDYLATERLNVSKVKIKPPKKQLTGNATMDVLASFNSKMERKGLVLPTGHYNSFNGKMIDGPLASRPTDKR